MHSMTCWWISPCASQSESTNFRIAPAYCNKLEPFWFNTVNGIKVSGNWIGLDWLDWIVVVVVVFWQAGYTANATNERIWRIVKIVTMFCISNRCRNNINRATNRLVCISPVTNHSHSHQPLATSYVWHSRVSVTVHCRFRVSIATRRT